jgi:hypothetical protein
MHTLRELGRCVRVIRLTLSTRTLRGKVTLLKGEGDVVWLHPLVSLRSPLTPCT